jgi:hypothetical protein
VSGEQMEVHTVVDTQHVVEPAFEPGGCFADDRMLPTR